jgi:hypothetical protein
MVAYNSRYSESKGKTPSEKLKAKGLVACSKW